MHEPRYQTEDSAGQNHFEEDQNQRRKNEPADQRHDFTSSTIRAKSFRPSTRTDAPRLINPSELRAS